MSDQLRRKIQANCIAVSLGSGDGLEAFLAAGTGDVLNDKIKTGIVLFSQFCKQSRSSVSRPTGLDGTTIVMDLFG